MFNEIIPWMNCRLLAIIIGLFFGLLGCRLHRISLFVFGFMFGFGIGNYVGTQFESAILSISIGIALGIAFGLTGSVFFRFGLFLTGAIVGNAVADIIIIESGLNIPPEQLWRLGISIIGGLLANAVRKLALITATSIIGAYLIYISTKEFLSSYNSLWHWALYTVLLFIFLITQFSSTRHSKSRYSSPSRYRTRY